MCVLLMLAVNVLTLLTASPVPVARDTLEMESHVWVSDIGVGRGWQMPFRHIGISFWHVSHKNNNCSSTIHKFIVGAYIIADIW